MKRYSIKEDMLELIYCGTFAPGEKLPSIRSVAKSYHCSITPVVEAYNDLVALHIIESKPSSGYYVSEDYEEHPSLMQHQEIRSNRIERYTVLNEVAEGYEGNVVFIDDDIRFSFGATAACVDYYPVRLFSQELVNATKRIQTKGENYQIRIHDLPLLKHEIMKWMMDVGKAVNISELSIESSASNALLLAIRVCAEPGDLIAIEAPGFIGFYFHANILKLNVLAVPSDPITGLDVDAFEQSLKEGKRPSCLVCSSTYTNPTGACMPDDQKERLVELCAKYQIPIIEDDVLGYISFEESRPRPLKSFDRDNVIYISGFSKALLPEIRLAWIAPGKYADRIALYKHQLVAYAANTIQLATASFLKRTDTAKAFHQFKKQLQKNMLEQIRIINECFPLEQELICPKGGIYIWVPLSKELDARALAKKCTAHGLTIAPAETFHVPETEYNCFRLNSVAVPWDDQAREALRKLGKIAMEMHDLICQRNKKRI